MKLRILTACCFAVVIAFYVSVNLAAFKQVEVQADFFAAYVAKHDEDEKALRKLAADLEQLTYRTD